MRPTGRRATALVAVLVLAGCGRSAAASPEVAAEVRTEATCLDPDVLAVLGLELDPSLQAEAPPAAVRGAPPEDFVADTALVCDRGETLRDSDGRWWAITATRVEGDLDALIDLADPGAPAACEAAVVPQVWLVDAMGAAVLLPRDAACPLPEFSAVLAGLSVVQRTEHPVALAQRAITPSPAGT